MRYRDTNVGNEPLVPELPEVETVRRGLEPHMEGTIIDRVELRRKDLRFPFDNDFAKKLDGQRIISIGRRAKYLLVDIDNGLVLVMHLGMSGSFRVEQAGLVDQPGEFALPKGVNKKHDHVIFHITSAAGAKTRIVYNDPRRFGFMALIERSKIESHPWFVDMGIEPVGNALNGDYLAGKFHHKKAPLKAALLDQKMIAGLGNIYVCEALWRAGLSPERSSYTLARKSGKATAKANRLAGHIRDVINEAIAAGGSSLKDHRQTDGSLGYFQHNFAVYGREGEPCRKSGCTGKIKRLVQSGRSTFYCSKCQR